MVNCTSAGLAALEAGLAFWWLQAASRRNAAAAQRREVVFMVRISSAPCGGQARSEYVDDPERRPEVLLEPADDVEVVVEFQHRLEPRRQEQGGVGADALLLGLAAREDAVHLLRAAEEAVKAGFQRQLAQSCAR